MVKRTNPLLLHKEFKFVERYEFKLSQEILKSRIKQLVVEYRKGNHPQATWELSKTGEDNFFSVGKFVDQNRVALQRTV